MENPMENIGNKLPKVLNKNKTKLAKKDIDFLTAYVENNYNKIKTIKQLKMDKKNGKTITEQQMINRANSMLQYPICHDYIKDLQRKVLERSVFTLERSINETYADYEYLKETNRWHEANVAHQMFLNITGQAKPNGAVSVNQQFISDKPITIVYKIDDKDGEKTDPTN